MKKQHLQKLLPFLLALALAGAMAWHCHVFINWNLNAFIVTSIVTPLAFLALAVSVVWPGKAKTGWKCLQIFAWLAAFIAVEQGVTYAINIVKHNAGGARPAMRAMLPLLALLVALLLVKPLLALGRGGRLAAGASVLAALIVGGYFIMPTLDFSGVYGLNSKLAYTFAYSAEKIQSDEALGKMETIRVTMGKNEREGFQFILRGRGAWPQYCIELSDVVNENGDTIPVSMYKEHYIYAGDGKQAGIYPDALVPYPINQNTLEIARAGGNQGYYFELHTDLDTPAGLYTGTISALQRRQLSDYSWETIEMLVEADFTVEVLDVTFPDAAFNDTAVGVSFSGQFFALNGVDQGTPEAEALYKQYYDYLLDHKISAYSLPYDILDERADTYMSDPRVKAFLIPYPKEDEQLLAYYQKVQSNPEWARKGYFYPIDEPHTAAMIDSYNAITDRLAALCPGCHMVTPFSWKFNDNGTQYDNLAIQNGRSDIICPISNEFDKRGFPEAVQKRVEENGDRAWWYVCCGPGGDYCNMFIHQQGTRHRLLFWQQYQQSLTGLLYWSSVYWEKANPWFSSVTWNSWEACGDGSWFYPGPAVGLREPVPSLRLKVIADGLEDYDLLRMAEEAFGREYCLEKAGLLSRSLTSYTSDPAKIEGVRVGILRDLAAAGI